MVLRRPVEPARLIGMWLSAPRWIAPHPDKTDHHSLPVLNGESDKQRISVETKHPLFTFDIYRVIGDGLRRNFLEPVRRLCGNGDDVAHGQMVSYAARSEEHTSELQ